MSLYIASLNSGSNGNCYYVGSGQEAVLIDAGISCREIEKRMRRLKLDTAQVKAVFVSHEHGDHIHGVSALSKKHKIPVYITPATLRASNMEIEPSMTISFMDEKPVSIGEMVVTPLSKQHDAIDPYSFVISRHGVNVGVFTDIGHACTNVVHYFKQCHAAFLESNYDAMMLERGGYPAALKNRIRNGKGHLSNHQAAELFADHRPRHMRHLFLSHLSRNNNTPEAALQAFDAIQHSVEIIIASRYEETALYHVSNIEDTKSNGLVRGTAAKPEQLSLF
jgi:phosphoribosyl 1,2-cyclic phosphodiesterase